MPSLKYISPILKGKIFHIFNRGINQQTVFHDDQDKRIFLERFRKYLGDYCEVLCFCILDNHYHFLLRIKEGKDLPSNFSKQFGKLILSYTHYYNRKYQHSGPVFHRRFKRLIVETEDYLRHLIWYIHSNPLKHGVEDEFWNYYYCSFYFISRRLADPLLSGSYTLELFGGLEPLMKFHSHSGDENHIKKLAME